MFVVTTRYMAITSSAKKALRVSKRKRIKNIRRISAIDSSLKKFRKLIVDKKADEATKLLPELFKAYDKAAKVHSIKKGAADRAKSRLVAAIKRISK
jgi:ribosomal protein S20